MEEKQREEMIDFILKDIEAERKMRKKLRWIYLVLLLASISTLIVFIVVLIKNFGV